MTFLGTLTLHHMTVTKIWHLDILSQITISQEPALESLDSATRTILQNWKYSKTVPGYRLVFPSQLQMLLLQWSCPRRLNMIRARQKLLVAGYVSQQILLCWNLLDISAEDDIRERIGILSTNPVRLR